MILAASVRRAGLHRSKLHPEEHRSDDVVPRESYEGLGGIPTAKRGTGGYERYLPSFFFASHVFSLPYLSTSLPFAPQIRGRIAETPLPQVYGVSIRSRDGDPSGKGCCAIDGDT